MRYTVGILVAHGAILRRVLDRICELYGYYITARGEIVKIGKTESVAIHSGTEDSALVPILTSISRPGTRWPMIC